MIQLPHDFKEFLALLNSKSVEYLLVGGYAVALYGYPRTTGDMDIWIAINEKNAQAVVGVLEDFGFSSHELKKEIFLEEGKNIRMGVPPLRLEIVTSIDGVQFENAYQQKKIIDIDGVPIAVISLEDLIKNKRTASRHKDLDDIEHLDPEK